MPARGVVVPVSPLPYRSPLRTRRGEGKCENVQEYQASFIEFMVRSGVLMFGDFTTKSGRRTPYFINTGRYTSGDQMARLGEYYARAIVEQVDAPVDFLFGPAYKGIPLAVTTAIALSTHHNRSVGVCFNRKEAKDHGEGGVLIGHPPRDGERVVIVEDVTTAGTSIRETLALLGPIAAVHYAAVVVSVDRMERGSSSRSALDEIRSALGIAVYPLVTLNDIVTHLHRRTIDGEVVLTDEVKARIDSYRQRYGAP